MRTVRNSLSRRIALRRPKTAEIQDCAMRSNRWRATPTQRDRKLELEEELTRKLRRTGLIPYIDPLDVRYKRFEAHPKPVAQAVMFCLMDVSGSMTEHMKDLAKRFYRAALYLPEAPLQERRRGVHPPHPHGAGSGRGYLLHSPETGGTVVSTALEEMQRVMQERYSRTTGTSTPRRPRTARTASDNDKTAALLHDMILPACQYYAYLEDSRLPAGFIRRDRPVADLQHIMGRGAPMAMRKVGHRRDIYPVFRELFESSIGEGRNMSIAQAERPLFEGADWEFSTIQRCHEAIEQVAREDMGLDIYPTRSR